MKLLAVSLIIALYFVRDAKNIKCLQCDHVEKKDGKTLDLSFIAL